MPLILMANIYSLISSSDTILIVKREVVLHWCMVHVHYAIRLIYLKNQPSSSKYD